MSGKHTWTINNPEDKQVNSIELVVDELANNTDQQSEESLKKEEEQQLSKEIEEEKKKTQIQIKEREERIKHLKELEEVEKSLKAGIEKQKLERHNLESWQDQGPYNTRRDQHELTESNLNNNDQTYSGGEGGNKELDSTIQTKRYFLLDKIRINSVNLANYHNHRYHVYKNILFTIFRVPLILLAGLNSFFSVGLQAYIAQSKISLITAIVSLFCGILTSIELLLNLQKRMEMEQETGKAYYKLSVEIYTELGKAIKDRGVKGDLRDFLKTKYNDYQNLFANANTVNMSERNFIDEFELYIDPDNADADDFNLETGTVDLHCRERCGEFSSDDSDGKERGKT